MGETIKAKTYGCLEPEFYFNRSVSISSDTLEHDPTAEFKVLLQLEPPSILDLTTTIIQNKNDFDLILAWKQDVVDGCDNSLFFPFGSCWVDEEHRLIHDKTKLISIISSHKNMTVGHRLRHEIISTDKSLDLYGRGYNPIDNKITALKDYMFSVVIENSTTKNYFSEKIIDCLITGTIPVFWGCENISEFFDEKGFIFFNNVEEYKEIRDTLTKEKYIEMLPHIKKNFELSLKYSEFWVRLESTIKKSLFDFPDKNHSTL